MILTQEILVSILKEKKKLQIDTEEELFDFLCDLKDIFYNDGKDQLNSTVTELILKDYLIVNDNLTIFVYQKMLDSLYAS